MNIVDNIIWILENQPSKFQVEARKYTIDLSWNEKEQFLKELKELKK